jgi:hypothetical protein
MITHKELDLGEAFAKAHAELTQHCEAALAKLDAIEARRVEHHKAEMAALDAMLVLIDNFSKPKGDAK